MTLLDVGGYDADLPGRSRVGSTVRLMLLICAVGVIVAVTTAAVAAFAWSALAGVGH